MVSLRRLLHACVMFHLSNAHYQSTRRERSCVQFSRNRRWIYSISAHIGRYRTSASCRRWLSESLIGGSLPTAMKTTWFLKISQRTVAIIPTETALVRLYNEMITCDRQRPGLCSGTSRYVGSFRHGRSSDHDCCSSTSLRHSR